MGLKTVRSFFVLSVPGVGQKYPDYKICLSFMRRSITINDITFYYRFGGRDSLGGPPNFGGEYGGRLKRGRSFSGDGGEG